MIGHLFKLVWNRKRTNLLIVLEILCSFLVVFGLTVTAFHLYGRYRQPLGFDYTDVWYINVDRNTERQWDEWPPEEVATFRRLLQALESMDEVVAATGSNTAPYKGSTHITGWSYDGRKVGPELSHVTPSFIDVLGLELVSGRWIEAGDAALDWTPVVLDEELARLLVGDEDPVGQRVSDAEEKDLRVVGVVRDYRRAGELDVNSPYVFSPARLEIDDKARPLSVLILKLAPGTRADFEEPMLKTLQAIAGGWSFNVFHLEQAREGYLRGKLIPLAFLGLIAGFLLLMVVLGLTGVMWQNVTRRTREIGLRRATGARRVRIQRQIVGEVTVTAGLGLFIGSLLAIQVPFVGPFTFVSLGVVLQAMLVSGVLILTLAAVCGLYPGWSATRIHPAEALHYE